MELETLAEGMVQTRTPLAVLHKGQFHHELTQQSSHFRELGGPHLLRDWVLEEEVLSLHEPKVLLRSLLQEVVIS